MNKTRKIILLFILNLTWCLFQNMGGFCRFLFLKKYGVYVFHGAIVCRTPAKKRAKNAFAAGMFIFLPFDCDPSTAEKLLVHEYGHCLQSMVLGPFFGLIVSLPSTIWCKLPLFEKLRRKRSISYYRFYCEAWASKWGERATGLKTFH